MNEKPIDFLKLIIQHLSKLVAYEVWLKYKNNKLELNFLAFALIN